MARTTIREIPTRIVPKVRVNDKYRRPELHEPRERFKTEITPRYANESGRGRPQIYDDDRFPHIAKVLCSEYGLTSEQLGKVFGVGKRTVEDWIQNHPKFKEHVREGKDMFDFHKVENALLKRALGYEYEEVTTQTIHVKGKDSEGLDVSVPAKRVTVTKKEVVADVKACLFWLTNRNPDRWKIVTNVNANLKGKVDHVHSGTVVHANLDSLNKDQLLALRDMVAAQQNAIPAEYSVVDDKKDDTLQLEHIIQNLDDFLNSEN